MTASQEPGPSDGQEQPAPGLPPAPPISPQEQAPATTRRDFVIGIVVGLVVYALTFGVVAAQGVDPDGYVTLALALAIVGVSLALLVVGVVLVFFQRARLLAAGLLVSVGVGVLVDGGACVALAASL